MTTKTVTDIMQPKMAVLPRLVIEVRDPEFNYMLKTVALKERKSMKEIVLLALAAKHPELADVVKAELE